MPRTLNCRADNRALIERCAIMRANGPDSMNFTVQFYEQHGLFFDQSPLELPLNQFRCCYRRLELVWTASVGIAVDHDPQVEHHDSSQIAAACNQQISR